MRTIQSLRLRAALLYLGALFVSACASEDTADAVVGSGHMQELSTEAAFVERVTITLPFRTIVYNGEPRKLVVRGEDNLISHVDVQELSAGKWKISVPDDLRFEQHQDVEFEIPYLDMVEFRVGADNVDFADDPATVWLDGE